MACGTYQQRHELGVTCILNTGLKPMYDKLTRILSRIDYLWRIK